MRFLLPFILCLSTAQGSYAQSETRDVMVVFDMSGSMWGQVDGVPKVEIARDAFDGLFDSWKVNNTQAGLIAYGHRERGNCADIETLAVPKDGADIAALVAGMSPKGKTPLSDAVRQAAEVLRFTEEAATVVLLSDGVETCQADPCAVGAELEALGLDFTAHVIGFDIAEGDKAQLQCLAAATGGKYFDAADAGELAKAMDGVGQAMAGTADPVVETLLLRDLTIRAAIAKTLRLPKEFTVFAGDTAIGTLTESTATLPGLSVSLPLGAVTLRVEGKGISGELAAVVDADTEILTITVEAPPADYILSRIGQFPILSAGASQYIMVNNTTGVDRASFYTTFLYPSGSTDKALRIKGGNIAPEANQFNLTTLTSPATPGDYDLVMMGTNGKEYDRIAISFAADIAPVWQGLREVDPNAVIDALWAGPSGRSNGFQFLSADQDLTDASYSRRTGIEVMATPDGFKLTAPSQVGLYRLVFFTNVENNRTFDVVDLGLIGVGVPLPDPATDVITETSTDTPNVAPSDPLIDPLTDSMAEEAAAMGGEDGELTEVGDLHGDWRLIFQNSKRTIPLLRLNVVQDESSPIANGDYSVSAHEDWQLGAAGDYGGLTLAHETNGGLMLTLLPHDGDTMTMPLTSSDIGWRGEVTPSNDAAQSVMFLKAEDLATAEIAADQTPVDLYMQAVDERGVRVSGPVKWTITRVTTQAVDQVTTDGGKLYETGRAPGAYHITAQAGELAGSYTAMIGRGQPAGYTLVMKPAREGRDLALSVAYYCSEGEVCEMHLEQMPITFTLPVGWGAERPIYTPQFDPMFNMTVNTADGPFFATLNQPQRMASLGPCTQLVTGTFCHDATDDPDLLADIAVIQRSLSFKPAGLWLNEERFDTLLNQLTGAAQ